MYGNFRKPEFVKRYEYTYYDLETPLNAIVPNNARQRKDNYRFVGTIPQKPTQLIGTTLIWKLTSSL